MTFKSFLTISALTITLACNQSFAAQEISTAAQFENEVIKSAQPVVVKFSTQWCGPCKQFAPIFDAVSHEPAWQSKVKFIKMDTDKCGDVASKYNVRSIPTTVFFKNGKEVGRINGAPSKYEFVSKIKSHFAL